MSSRGATPGLHHRTGTQSSFQQAIPLASRAKRGLSFNRDYVRLKDSQTGNDDFAEFSCIENYGNFFDLFDMQSEFV